MTYQGSGDSYIDEWAAEGVDDFGGRVLLKWHFEIAREGREVLGAYPAEMLPEDYDWDDWYEVIYT